MLSNPYVARLLALLTICIAFGLLIGIVLALTGQWS